MSNQEDEPTTHERSFDDENDDTIDQGDENVNGDDNNDDWNENNNARCSDGGYDHRNGDGLGRHENVGGDGDSKRPFVIPRSSEKEMILKFIKDLPELQIESNLVEVFCRQAHLSKIYNDCLKAECLSKQQECQKAAEAAHDNINVDDSPSPPSLSKSTQVEPFVYEVLTPEQKQELKLKLTDEFMKGLRTYGRRQEAELSSALFAKIDEEKKKRTEEFWQREFKADPGLYPMLKKYNRNRRQREKEGFENLQPDCGNLYAIVEELHTSDSRRSGEVMLLSDVAALSADNNALLSSPAAAVEATLPSRPGKRLESIQPTLLPTTTLLTQNLAQLQLTQNAASLANQPIESSLPRLTLPFRIQQSENLLAQCRKWSSCKLQREIPTNDVIADKLQHCSLFGQLRLRNAEFGDVHRLSVLGIIKAKRAKLESQPHATTARSNATAPSTISEIPQGRVNNQNAKMTISLKKTTKNNGEPLKTSTPNKLSVLSDASEPPLNFMAGDGSVTPIAAAPIEISILEAIPEENEPSGAVGVIEETSQSLKVIEPPPDQEPASAPALPEQEFYLTQSQPLRDNSLFNEEPTLTAADLQENIEMDIFERLCQLNAQPLATIEDAPMETPVYRYQQRAKKRRRRRQNIEKVTAPAAVPMEPLIAAVLPAHLTQTNSAQSADITVEGQIDDGAAGCNLSDSSPAAQQEQQQQHTHDSFLLENMDDIHTLSGLGPNFNTMMNDYIERCESGEIRAHNYGAQYDPSLVNEILIDVHLKIVEALTTSVSFDFLRFLNDLGPHDRILAKIFVTELHDCDFIDIRDDGRSISLKMLE